MNRLTLPTELRERDPRGDGDVQRIDGRYDRDPRNEIGMAKRIQQRLMPTKSPALQGLQMHGICRACSDVGGDFFDFFELPGERVGLIIADVCGKGVAGALLAASLQAALRGGLNFEASARERMSWLNGFIHAHSPVDRFITASYVELDAKTGLMTQVCAGHPHRSFGGPVDAGQKIEQSGLTTARTSNHRNEFAGGHGDAEMVDGDESSLSQGVCLDDIIDFYRVARHRALTPATPAAASPRPRCSGGV